LYRVVVRFLKNPGFMRVFGCRAFAFADISAMAVTFFINCIFSVSFLVYHFFPFLSTTFFVMHPFAGIEICARYYINISVKFANGIGIVQE
jgi:hypothetical protein